MTTNDLIETLEKLRSEKHSELDAKLVMDVIQAQADFMANPTEASKRIELAVEEYLARKDEE